MIDKFEDKDICKKCGGFCCKKSGCDYFVSDFKSMKLVDLDEILKSGYTSIVALLSFERLNNGKLIAIPTLYLRARNRNRDVVDLLSMKTTCLALEENGCRYSIDERPSGGSSLIPVDNGKCYSEVDRLQELKKWVPYQKVLGRLVKWHTGMNVDDRLKEDVKKLFYNLLSNNIEDVSLVELLDIKSMLPHLKEAFYEEYKEAHKMYKDEIPVLVKNRVL